MLSVQKALFPGIFVGCLFLIFATGWIANPNFVLAPAPAVVATLVAKPQAAAQSLTDAANASAASAAEAGSPGAQPAAENAAVAKAETKTENSSPTSNGECTLSSSYPDSVRQWCDLIVRYAGENGLEANLVAAVILQESGGNPKAFSKSGAVGLMQVMPNDGLASSFMCINGPCFSARPSTDELYDPEFNISYGTRMLSALINKKGDVREALRSYGPINMGYRYADIILGIKDRYQ